MNDGKHLEALVAFVEEKLLPEGYEVKTNKRIYNDDGIQIAEFDVEIRGKLGTTEIAWLIECRDRPGSGAAPSSWIEQLVGRRTRFRFNKVTAVSTTGFAEGAQEFARREGIELRVVEALTPDAFSSWLLMEHMNMLESKSTLKHANVLINRNTPEVARSSLESIIETAKCSGNILRSSKTSELSTLAGAFLAAVQHKKLFDGMAINGEPKSVTLHVKYTNDDDHFVIDTDSGPVRIEVIEFTGELRVIEKLVPIAATTKYRNLETGETISQVVAFEPQNFSGTSMSLEFHRMGEDGETHIILRRAKGDA